MESKSWENSLDRQYYDIVYDIIFNGVEKADRTGVGTKSIFGTQIRHNMDNGFPLLTTKKVAFKQVAIELLWFLSGETNIKPLIEAGCHIWDGDAYKNYEKQYDLGNAPGETLLVSRVDGKSTERKLSIDKFIAMIQYDDEFASSYGDLGPIYGKQWRNWNGIDQIKQVIQQLKENPDSRRLMVNAWNVGELNQMVLPPCHYGFQLYTRELSFEERVNLSGHYAVLNGRDDLLFELATENTLDEVGVPHRSISLMWNQRSVDVALGLPFNLASYGLLLMMIAREVNMHPSELIFNGGDTHLYLNHIEEIERQMNNHSFVLPTVKLEGMIPNDISEYSLDNIKLENYQNAGKVTFKLNN